MIDLAAGGDADLVSVGRLSGSADAGGSLGVTSYAAIDLAASAKLDLSASAAGDMAGTCAGGRDLGLTAYGLPPATPC